MRTNAARVVRYLVAGAAAGAAHVLTRLIWPVVDPTQSPLSFAAVLVSAWYGGLGPGLVATGLTVIMKAYFFAAPTNSFRVESGLHLAQLALFAAVAFLVSSLTAALHRADAESRAARADAESATRAQELFLAAISHELRTPLQAMATWIRVLRDDADPARTHAAVEALARSVAAQTRLIDDLLDRSRLVAGKIALALEPLDLAAVVEAAVDTARAAARPDAPAVRTELDPPGRPVFGDRTRLEQVVTNLVSNALKFTPAHGAVVVRLTQDGMRARLTVEDTGRGIPRELVAHVFEPFRQARTEHGAPAGLGLGLAITRDLVHLHGGAVHVKSAGPGRGATFVVELPLAEEHRANPVTPSTARA
jgi:signal transduction histidine kinase